MGVHGETRQLHPACCVILFPEYCSGCRCCTLSRLLAGQVTTHKQQNNRESTELHLCALPYINLNPISQN